MEGITFQSRRDEPREGMWSINHPTDKSYRQQPYTEQQFLTPQKEEK